MSTGDQALSEPAGMEPVLPTRRLGRTSLQLTLLGLGSAPLGELFEKVPEDIAEAVVETAFRAGIRYYDTAPWYGHGLSEHRLGRSLRQHPRNNFIVSTKVGRCYRAPADRDNYRPDPWVGGLPFEPHFDYSYDGVMRSYQDSLLRLGLNRVDCLLIHDLDEGYHGAGEGISHHRESLERGGWPALAELRECGEIRAIGAGINDHRMMRYFTERFDIDFLLVAMPYTLLDQTALQVDFEVCRKRNIGIIVGSPFASGILATGASAGASYNYAPAPPDILEKVRRIESLCLEHDVSLQAAALQFPLGHPSVASIIPGATDARFILQNRDNLFSPIPPEFWAALKSDGLIEPESPEPAGFATL